MPTRPEDFDTAERLRNPRVERGVPYSVSWFDQGDMLRVDRVYLLDEVPDPWGWRLLDALTGRVLVVWHANMPLFRGPSAPSLSA